MDVLENWRAIEFTSLIILHSSCTEALHHIEEGPRAHTSLAVTF
jgi:hypothetical protein